MDSERHPADLKRHPCRLRVLPSRPHHLRATRGSCIAPARAASLAHASLQNRIGPINHAVLYHRIDVRRMRDVIDRIRIENHKVGETTVLEITGMRTDFAAEKLRSVRRGALQYLH